jgi:hypothetical protein
MLAITNIVSSGKFKTGGSMKNIVSIVLTFALLLNASGYSFAQTVFRPEAQNKAVPKAAAPLKLLDKTPLKTKVDSVKKYVDEAHKQAAEAYEQIIAAEKECLRETKDIDPSSVVNHAGPRGWLKIGKSFEERSAYGQTYEQIVGLIGGVGLLSMFSSTIFDWLGRTCTRFGTKGLGYALLKIGDKAVTIGGGMFMASVALSAPLVFGDETVPGHDPSHKLKGVDYALYKASRDFGTILNKTPEELYEIAKHNRTYELYIDDLYATFSLSEKYPKYDVSKDLEQPLKEWTRQHDEWERMESEKLLAIIAGLYRKHDAEQRKAQENKMKQALANALKDINKKLDTEKESIFNMQPAKKNAGSYNFWPAALTK